MFSACLRPGISVKATSNSSAVFFGKKMLYHIKTCADSLLPMIPRSIFFPQEMDHKNRPRFCRTKNEKVTKNEIVKLT